MCGFAVHLGTQLWTLVRLESGFRVGNVPATRLLVVSAFRAMDLGMFGLDCLGVVLGCLVRGGNQQAGGVRTAF